MQTVKRLINDFLIKISGYCIVKYKAYEQMYERSANSIPYDYSVRAFCIQSIFDFFPRWVSRFEIDNAVYGGPSDYRTIRISMLNEEALYELVDFTEKAVLEVGPLEGGNAIILERLHARKITAVEGHLENYIRCCVIKNLAGLNKTTFYFDDAMNLAPEKYGTFDLALIAGLLYHLDRPHLFLNQLGRMASQLVISTHFADDESPSPDAEIQEITFGSSTYRGKLFREGTDPNSGLQQFSFWPFKQDLLRMLQDAGYGQVHIIRELTDQPTKYKLIYLVAEKADRPVLFSKAGGQPA